MLKHLIFECSKLFLCRRACHESFYKKTQCMYMVWREVWGQPFQIRSSSNLGPPVIQGSKVLLSASQEYVEVEVVVCRRSEPLFYRKPPLYGYPPFLYFFQTHCFWQDFSGYIAPMKYQINTKINSCGKVIFSFSEDFKATFNIKNLKNTQKGIKSIKSLK